MIVPYEEVLSFTEESESERLERTHKGIDEQVKNWIGWNPEQVAHVNKLYDGSGTTDLFLDEKHVTAFTRAGLREEAIRIKNISTDATNAYVTVDQANDQISCVQQGGTNAGTNTVDLTSDTTLTTVVAAINAFGGGWSSEIVSSNFNSYLSANLLDVDGQFVGAWNGAEPGFYDFDMAGVPFQGVELYEEQGRLYYASGFRKGRKRICVSYTSGYTDALMPDDLKLGVLILVQSISSRSSVGSLNISEYSLGHLRVKYGGNGNGGASDIETAIQYLDQFRKRVIV